MANAKIAIKEDASPTKQLASQTTDTLRGGETVHREEVVIGDPTVDGAVAAVVSAAPTTEPGLVVRNIPSGTQNVADGGGALTVDALDLDIRNLAPATDEVQSRDKAQFDDVAPSLPAEDAYADLRITANRAVHVNLRSAGGVELGLAATPLSVGDGGASLTVDGTVTVTATNLDVRDLAHTQDSVRIGDGTDLALVTAAGALVVDGSTVTQPVGGNIAHDSADSGNPVKIGAKAAGALPTAVAAADRVDAYYDREGRQIVRPWGAGAWSQVHLPAVNVRATTTKTAGAAGVRHIATGLTVVLAGDSTAPAAAVLDVRLRDGIADTGTILWQAKITLPAVAGAMNGITRTGLFIPGSAATAMTLEFSAAGGANTFESVSLEGVDVTEA